ncbi:MAG: hypothetical protein WKF81_03645 [Thermomicrobiales bacterium]
MRSFFFPGNRWRAVYLILAVTTAILVTSIAPATADHESLTRMTFAPVTESADPAASGVGMVKFHGGEEPDSRWTATFQYFGLRPATMYAVVVQGRFGEDGSEEAAAYTPVCEFVSGDDGSGGCWFYFVGLKRLGVVQVRVDGPDGEAVLQASNKDGPGDMDRTANAYSLTLTATPGDRPDATPQQ